MEQWGQPLKYPGVPPDKDRTATAAIVISLVIVIVVVTLGILFLTGVIRFGKPSVDEVTTASRVDESNRPEDSKKAFSGNEERVYCCCVANAFGDTVFEVRWFYGQQLIGEEAKKFDKIVGASTGRFVTSSANVAFFMDMPQEGWVPGRYSVAVLIDGTEKTRQSFTIGPTGDGDADMTLYREPSGLFSIRHPSEWLPADTVSLEGALVGFISPEGDPYPPRFAVLLTDFESVSLEYLNGLLAEAEVPEEEMFQSYSLGESVGARRTFTWSVTAREAEQQLKSVQVLIQSDSGTYGVNCHSLAAEFDEHIEVFNSIINSFRVHL